MKKLLLIALVIGGFAFAAQRSDGQSTTGSVLGFQVVTPLPSYLNYYPYGYYRRPYVHYFRLPGMRIHTIPLPQCTELTTASSGTIIGTRIKPNVRLSN